MRISAGKLARDKPIMKRTKVIFAALAFCLFLAAQAQADLIPIGEPYDTDSWTQHWSLSTTLGPFDNLIFNIQLGSPQVFRDPGIGAFVPNNINWHQTYDTGTVLKGAGNSVAAGNTLEFDLTFSESKNQSAKFRLEAYNVVTFVDWWMATWTPTGSNKGYWTVEHLQGAPETETVPEPAALGLLGLGLLAIRRRRT